MGTLDKSDHLHQNRQLQLIEALMFICMQKMNFISDFLFKILPKTLQTCYLGNFENAWPSPSKTIVSICKKISCLFVCITCFFLKILQKNSKLVIFGNLSIPSQKHMIVWSWKKLICSQKVNSIPPYFCGDIAKICKLLILGTLSMPGYTHPKS